jgi:hypothetical protein
MEKLTADLWMLLVTPDGALDRLTKDRVRSEGGLIRPPTNTNGRSAQLPRYISWALSGNLSYF